MKYTLLPLLCGILTLIIDKDITILTVTLAGIICYAAVKATEKLAERKRRKSIARQFRKEMSKLEDVA